MKYKITAILLVLSVMLSNMTYMLAEENEFASEQTDEEIAKQQQEMIDIYQGGEDSEEDEKSIIDVLEKEDTAEENKLTLKEEEAIGLMKAIGAIPKNCDLEKRMTRAEFAASVYAVSGYYYSSDSAVGAFSDVDKNTEYYEEISVLRDSGIVSGYSDQTFRPSEEINIEAVSKMLVHIVGYEWQREYSTSYQSIADDNRFFKGISLDGDYITYKQAACILLNVLETDVSETSAFNINGKYMECVLKIGKVEGVFSDDGRFNELNNLIINAKSFAPNEEDYSDLLYQKVTAYYKTNADDDNVILSISAYKNQKIIRITDKEIEIYNNRCYEYIAQGENKMKSARMETAFDIVYNGVEVTEGTTDNLMKPENGYVELIDYDNNNLYDTVVIWDYKVFVVDTYNKNTMLLTSKNGEDDILLEDIPYDIFMAGSENRLSTDNIAYSDYVLSVARANKDKYARIYLCEEVKGAVKGFDSENVKIDETIYGVMKGVSLNVGKSGYFYVDAFGRVVYYKSILSESVKYAYVIKKYYNEDDENIWLKVFSQDSETINAPVSEKAVIDGRRPEQINGISVALDDTEGTIIKVKLNKNGEIVYIDTVNNPTETDSLNKTYEATSGIGFNSSTMALAENSYGIGKCPVTLDTVVFCVSEPYENGKIQVYDMTEYSKVYATGYRVDLGKLIVYNNDINSGVGEVILNKRSFMGSNISYSSTGLESGAVVTDVIHTLNDYDEPCYCLTVERGTASAEIYVAEEAITFGAGAYTVSKGDIIKWQTDTSGIVAANGLTVIYDCDQNKFNYSEGSTTFARAMTNEAGRWHRMWVYKRDGDFLISYNQDLAPKETFNAENIKNYESYKYVDYTRDVSTYKTRVYIFNTSRNVLTEGSLADIKTYDNHKSNCTEVFGFTSTGHRLFIIYR